LSFRDQMQIAVTKADLDAIERLASEQPRSIRYLVSLMYRPDEGARTVGAKGIARAARHHPKIVKEIITRLVWAMSEGANTYAPAAPEVLSAIADENPELLVPVTSDLIRLSKDTSLNQGLCDTLRRVAERCPGTVGQEMTKSLNTKLKQGGCVGDRRRK
jgi:hypothetical protein